VCVSRDGSIVKFALAVGVYTARFDETIIVLDTIKDAYISLIENGAKYFELIITEFCIVTHHGYRLSSVTGENTGDNTLTYWISHFRERKLIVKVAENTETRAFIPLPLKSGGLIDYAWNYKVSWEPVSQSSKWGILKAFYQLIHVHHTIKRGGLKKLLETLESNSTRKKLKKPSEEEIQQLARNVDAATLLYPKKTVCLAWAATFVLLAIKRGFQCNLVIGIQAKPFYAHAWAESAGNVIHDDPQVAHVLSIILREPQFSAKE
jgi:hypothetical protein